MKEKLPIEQRVDELILQFKSYLPDDAILRELVIKDYQLMYSQGQLDLIKEGEI